MACVCLFSSCSVKRNLRDNQRLVKKNVVEIESDRKKDKSLESDLKSYIILEKNKSFMNFNTWVYNDHETKFKRWWKRISDKQPSYYDESLVSQSAEKMEIFLQNKGYFGSNVSYVTVPKNKKRPQNKKVEVVYTAHLTTPYRINEVDYHFDNPEISDLVMPILKKSGIRKGRQYDYYVLDDERDNITALLQNNGYFLFNADYIFFEIDSAHNDRTLKVTCNIRPNYLLEEYVDNPLNEVYDKKFNIREVYINPYPRRLQQGEELVYDTLTLLRPSYKNIKDTISYKLILTNEKPYFRTKALLPAMYLEPGDEYRKAEVAAARSNLSRLSAIGNAFIVFDTIPRAEYPDSIHGWLSAHVNIEQGVKQSISLNIEGTSDNVGAIGTSLSMSWSNRNLFRGSEVLTLQLKGAMEIQKTFNTEEDRRFFGIFNSLDGGIQLSLTFPRFLAPVSPYRFPRFFRPTTTINLGYNYQQRPAYSRNIFLGSFGYKWKPEQKISHTLTVLDLNLVKINKTPEFDSIIALYNNRRYIEQYSDHFIMALGYTFTYSNQEIGRNKNFSYVRVSGESCGNLLYGINSLFNSPKTVEGASRYYTLFNIRYAQYLKADVEFRQYLYTNTRGAHLVFRFWGGIGVPYGNAISLPFEKGFYGGGPNDLRGFPINLVGPGSFVSLDGLKYERSGDIKLEVNGEYRFNVYGILKGAIFMDAGNVWLLREDKGFKNGTFKINKFYKELYWNTGLGLRLDIDFFVIRLDLGVPIYNPGYNGEKWRMKNMQFKELVLNIGIGYPF